MGNVSWGPPQGGGQGAMPSPDFTRGGAVMHLAPPQILGKILLYTQLMYVFFFEKQQQWNAYIIVYILLKFSKTSKFFFKNFQNCQKNFEIS